MKRITWNDQHCEWLFRWLVTIKRFTDFAKITQIKYEIHTICTWLEGGRSIRWPKPKKFRLMQKLPEKVSQVTKNVEIQHFRRRARKLCKKLFADKCHKRDHVGVNMLGPYGFMMKAFDLPDKAISYFNRSIQWLLKSVPNQPLWARWSSFLGQDKE